MTEQVIALVAAFNSDSELLLLKRPDDAHCGGLWTLPGGKVNMNEAPLAAAMRELTEETGLHGEGWQELGESNHRYPDRELRFQLFACRCPELAGFHPESIAEWVSPSNLDSYPMPDANNTFIPLLKRPEERENTPATAA